MSGEQNLTPDQRMIPKPIRDEAYSRLPMTCDAVSEILTSAAGEVVDKYKLPPEDYSTLDDIIARAFIRIRDEITQPFRTEQMRLLLEWRKLGSTMFNNEGTKDIEHPFEGDLYLQLGIEFAKDRSTVKRTVFRAAFGLNVAGEKGKPMIDRCRDRLLTVGWIPAAKAKLIRFTRDVDALVDQGAAGFGSVENQYFEKGSSEEVKIVEVQKPPSSDMAKVVFADGTSAMLAIEDFEIIKPGE